MNTKKGDNQSTENKQPSTAYNHTLKCHSRKLTKQLLTHDFKSSFLFLFQSYVFFPVSLPKLCLLSCFSSKVIWLPACNRASLWYTYVTTSFVFYLVYLLKTLPVPRLLFVSLLSVSRDSWSLTACAIATSVFSFFLFSTFKSMLFYSTI